MTECEVAEERLKGSENNLHRQIPHYNEKCRVWESQESKILLFLYNKVK